jgi:hypothetical protein
MSTDLAPDAQRQTFRADRRPHPPQPPLRFEVHEAARMLRMSRAQLYNRMKDGLIRVQKDGARTYITRAELERYVASCD